MKTIIKNIFAALMLITFAATFTACEQDSPETIHSVNELSGEWTWVMDQDGDLNGSTGVVTISVNDNSTIVFHTFQNQKGNITAEVKGETFTFNGLLADGTMEVTNGEGKILDNWTMMKIKYTISNGYVTDNISATFTKNNITAKK